MFEADQGLSTSYWNQPFDWMAPWHRPARNNNKDARVNVIGGGGRRMKHPVLDDLVYPHPPDVTLNFGADRLRHVDAAPTRTLGGTSVAKFSEEPDDVQITEIWRAGQLSTEGDFWRLLYEYYVAELPPQSYIGWRPTDRTWKNFFIEILNVRLGSGREFTLDELGSRRPELMRQELAITFKLVREGAFPSGTLIFQGA